MFRLFGWLVPSIPSHLGKSELWMHCVRQAGLSKLVKVLSNVGVSFLLIRA